ncbi:hypothetical protein BGZ60DRAFT_390217 [Tricladium varicosporioides]|nr:hypothetical protein BGZ60DRAFT_390217 [Hymenoscyphus varicosporioides]
MNQQRTTAISGGSGTQSAPENNVGNNRRGSSGSGTMFSGLMNQKRNSTDQTAQARRASFAEQKPAVGIIGKMWNK